MGASAVFLRWGLVPCSREEARAWAGLREGRGQVPCSHEEARARLSSWDGA